MAERPPGRVIVVMPALDAARTLERTVESIPRDWVDEVILVDDNSSDGTVELERSILTLDQLQQKLNDGPCIDAAEQQALIHIPDTHRESRWPEFAAEAENLGVCSMLCVPLQVHEQCLGTLSLYSERVTAFTSHDEQVTTLFATLAAIALAEAQRTDQLHAALANRDVIGQAKGILMERNRITADAAFGYLARASQDVNMKLAAVARHLVETGELLSVARPER